MFHRDGFVQVDGAGQILPEEIRYDLSNRISGSTPIAAQVTIADGPSNLQVPGNLDGTEGGDVYGFNLTAGVTYSFAERPAAQGGIIDPLMAIFDSSFNFIALDDDGGAGRSSLLSFTPTTSGTYYIYASSWYSVALGQPESDPGNYTLDVWKSTNPDAGNTMATATAITEGATTYGTLTAGDVDMYAINLAGGLYHEFTLSGGVATGDEFGEADSVVAEIDVLDANGNVLASGLNFESGAGFVPDASGTYYVRITPYQNTTGGYTLDVSSTDLSTKSPLDTIMWNSASNVPAVDTNGDGVGDTIYVYFAQAGENFGEVQGDDPSQPLVSLGWNDYEKGQMMTALDYYEHITGLNFAITTDSSQAQFKFVTTQDEPYGGYMYPQDPVYGSQAGIGVFNVDSGGWGAFPQSLQEGGFSFEVMLHEVGHGLGFAHPHDNGGGSEVMPGVFGATGSYGVFDLNQGVYTVMSYNDGWVLNPDGPSSFTVRGIDNGWSTLGAFDIAALQQRYGVHDYNTGDNVYTLTDTADDAWYQAIWDTGGKDTIAYSGTWDAQIDLMAATLDYSPTGGGAISFLHNPVTDPATPNSLRVKGGYTIANGVVIENATGGSGNDVLLGNSANNTLTGNAGNDVLMGREGNDRLIAGAGNDKVVGGDGLDVATLGAGNDVFVAEVTATKTALKTGTMSVDIITDFNGTDDHIDLSGLGAFTFRGTNANKSAGDLTYKMYTSVTGAENALGIDIHDQPGAGGISGPVTVVYGNTDGGKPDFTLILLNTSSVAADDFIFTGSQAAGVNLGGSAGANTASTAGFSPALELGAPSFGAELHSAFQAGALHHGDYFM